MRPRLWRKQLAAETCPGARCGHYALSPRSDLARSFYRLAQYESECDLEVKQQSRPGLVARSCLWAAVGQHPPSLLWGCPESRRGSVMARVGLCCSARASLKTWVSFKVAKGGAASCGAKHNPRPT